MSEVDAAIWRAIFSAMKAALLAVAAIFYCVALAIYFITQNVAWLAEYLYKLVSDWRPVKPSVFRFENVKAQEVLDSLEATLVEAERGRE